MNSYLSSVQTGASSLAQPFVDMFSQVASFVPVLFMAFVVLVLGLIVSPIIGKVVTRGLELLKIDQLLDRAGAHDAMASIGIKFSFARVVGTLVKYVTLVVFINIIADILELSQLSKLILDVIRFIPEVVVALVIIGVGLTVADWLRGVVENIAQASDNADYAGILGSVTRISVIVFSVMAALVQVNIAPTLIQIMFAGVVFGFALAFGLGAKDTVARALDQWIK